MLIVVDLSATSANMSQSVLLTHEQTLARMARNHCSDLSSPGGFRGQCPTIAPPPKGLAAPAFSSFHSVAFLVQCLHEASRGQNKTI